MSLFVGNISRNVDIKELEKEFGYFGVCRVDLRVIYNKYNLFTIFNQGSFAFIEFNGENDAEDAKKELNGKNFGGLKVNIEWSKRSGRFDHRETQKKHDGRLAA